VARARIRAQRELRHDRPPLDDRAAEALVLGGIDDVEAGSEHGYRPARGLERPAVGGAIDSPREAGDDGRTRGR
jgi:hypothetical protein